MTPGGHGTDEQLLRLAAILAAEIDGLVGGEASTRLRTLAGQTADTLDMVSGVLRHYSETGEIFGLGGSSEGTAAPGAAVVFESIPVTTDEDA